MVSTQAASPATAWWQRYAEAHRAHAQMIPQLRAHQKVLTEATIALSGRITWEDQVCQTYQHDAFGRLLDYSGSAILALQHELYAGAVPQALLLLEQLIDLRYALFTDLQAAVRVMAKQEHAFAEAEKRALTWRHYAKQEDAAERDFAQQRLQFLRSLRAQLSSSHPGKIVWPSLLLRARAVGFEKSYHYLFASGVDATAQLDERTGVLNCYMRAPAEQRSVLLEAWEAERASHSVFITAQALWLYCTTMRELWTALAQQDGRAFDTGKLERISDELQTIVVTCEETHAEFTSPPTQMPEGACALPAQL